MAIDERLLNDPEFLQEAGEILKRTITQLKADLAKFGGHTAECQLIIFKTKQISDPMGVVQPECDCGYDKAKERWK